jgi:hypothetical protein
MSPIQMCRGVMGLLVRIREEIGREHAMTGVTSFVVSEGTK